MSAPLLPRGHQIFAAVCCRRLAWGGIFLAIILFDLTVPLGVAVGVLYIVPVLLTLWAPNKRATWTSALAGSTLILVGFLFSPEGAPVWQSVSNRALSLLAVWSTAVLIAQRKAVDELREKAVAAREKALDEVRILRGFIPICSACKKVRDDQGYWTQIEAYIRDRSEAQFSHSICPECAEKLYGDFFGREAKEEREG